MRQPRHNEAFQHAASVIMLANEKRCVHFLHDDAKERDLKVIHVLNFRRSYLPHTKNLQKNT